MQCQVAASGLLSLAPESSFFMPARKKELQENSPVILHRRIDYKVRRTIAVEIADPEDDLATPR